MKPVYVKKQAPEDRITWMDGFVAREPKPGFQDVVNAARNGSRVTASADLGLKLLIGLPESPVWGD